jgi:iron complex transport system ATP-binding protein
VDLELMIRQLACGYSGHPVLRDINLELGAGEILVLLGPNGVGKTTLFKTLLGFLPALGGEICLNGRRMAAWPRAELARQLAYVPQAHTPPFPYRVRDVVVMGRTAHMGLFAAPSAHDFALADEALDELGLLDFSARIYTELSGGEQQLVLIARALAQQPTLLLLDEPTANLDFGNQIRVLGQVIKLARRGLGVIMTTHAPDHAFLCAAQIPATQVALLQRGAPLLLGSVTNIITEHNLRSAYGVEVRIDSCRGLADEPLQICVPLLA